MHGRIVYNEGVGQMNRSELKGVVMNAKQKNTVMENATICLYGNRDIGFGWLAVYGGECYGNGEAKEGRGCTECVFQACDALVKAGATGNVEIYNPGATMMATANVNRPGYYGNLKWGPAKVWVIGVEEIEEAAARCAAERV